MRYYFDASELQRRRVDAGLSRRQLGAAVGRTTQAVVTYENGRSHPSTRILLLLCTELGCQPSDLLRPVLEPAAS